MKPGHLMLALFAAGLLAGCASESPVETNGGFARPFGIYYTTESSPDPLASWGNVYYPGDSKEGVHMDLPYPNPANTNTTITFSTARELRLKIWIARISDNTQPRLPATGGAILPTAQAAKNVRDIAYGLFEAGLHALDLRLTDNDGKVLPSGFYRVFMQTGTKLLWRDLAVCQDPREYPCSMFNF